MYNAILLTTLSSLVDQGQGRSTFACQDLSQRARLVDDFICVGDEEDEVGPEYCVYDGQMALTQVVHN